ncbi:MAG: hypothetical protein ABJB05_16255 [Parafilimonas sp.]
MIEVFKTNINGVVQARRLIKLLLQHLPGSRINIDLHDCDKVLRVEAAHFIPAAVMTLVKEHGFICSVLE